jgi:ribulose-phosphate 3-epimerase
MQIIPTVLEKDFYVAEERIKKIKEGSRWIQIDVIDNVFATGRSFDLELLNKLDFKAEDMLWDIHLMVKEPIDWIEKCLFIGASRIIGQVEVMSDRELFIKMVKDAGLEAGLAFDIGTEVGNIPKETDEILLMGRKAGFGKNLFEEKVFKKIEALRQAQDKLMIAIDGGVSLKNITRLEKLGADIVYSGNNYFDLINAD